jgi:Na+/proline symporter
MIMTVLLVILGWALHGFYQTRQNEVPCDVKHDTDKIFAFYFANDLPPGICGLLVAALCATTMSVFAGGINAATTCFIIDFVQNHRLLTANHGAVVNTVKLAKILTVCFGLLSIVIAILAQYINESLSLITSVAQAVCCAPTFGVFLLGMLSQRADSFDAAVGLGVCFAFMVYLLAGAAICTDSLPTQSCSKNDTAPDYSLVTAQPLHKLPSSCHGTLLVARVSQWLYPAVGSAVCFFSGLISMLIRRQSPPVTKIMGLTWWTREMGPLAEARLGANQHNYTDYDAAEVDPFLQTAYSKPIN